MKSLLLVLSGVFVGALAVELLNRQSRRKTWIVKRAASSIASKLREWSQN